MFAPTMSGRGNAQPSPDQRAASNEDIVRRLFREMHNRGDERVAHEVIASPRLVQRLKTCLLRLRSASPACHFTVDEIISLGDKVITRWTANVLLAGRPVQASGLSVFRLFNGRIVGLWQNWDELRAVLAT